MMNVATLTLDELAQANMGTVIATMAACVTSMLGVIGFFFKWMMRRSDEESQAVRASNAALQESNKALLASVDAFKHALEKMDEHGRKLDAIEKNTRRILSGKGGEHDD